MSQTETNGWVIENVHGPSQVGIVDTISVDLNRDGLSDVVSASIEDGHLRAYINQGDLKFKQQYISTDVLGAYRVSATDLNKDNKIDFLIPSLESHEIIALIAEDQGQPQPQPQPQGYRKQIIANNVLQPADAQAGDFNLDGLMDVVSVSFEGNLLLLHLQNNQGEFTTSVLSRSPLRPRKLVVADFNNDQFLDILLASSGDNSVRLFSNKGDATFNEFLISDQLTGVRYIARCDVSEGPYLDFVAGVTGANQVMLFTNNGQNNFSGLVIDNDLPGADGVHCADLDQDGTLELISISRVFDAIYTQEINGPQNKQLIANTRDGYITATAAVLERNTPSVILTQAHFQNRNLIYSPYQNNQETVIWEDFPDGAYYLDAGDLDGDGDQDLAYVAFRDDKVYWAEKTAEGYDIHTIFAGVDGPQSVKISDIDQDGDLDVLSAGAWDDSFRYHQNQGQGQFKTFLISDTANNAARIDVMDVNGDSKLDIITTSSLDDSLRWFDVNGVQFTETLIDNQLDGALALRADDINQDGIKDIVVGSYFANDITLFTNDGLGNFTKQTLSSDKVKPTSIMSADIDDDGDIDIVFNASHDNSLWLLENIAGNFQEVLINNRGSNVNDMALTDIDNDGDLDIIDVSYNSERINLNKNINHSTFQTEVLTQIPFGANAIISLSENNSNSPRFAIVSNSNNSLQIISRDLIFKSGFELITVP